jgi:hypothetical protein
MPRASWRGFLRLSLVSCPVYLSPATNTPNALAGIACCRSRSIPSLRRNSTLSIKALEFLNRGSRCYTAVPWDKGRTE